MSRGPSFSIVIPTFRRQTSLERLLLNISVQIKSFEDLSVEVIVADNCTECSARDVCFPDHHVYKYVSERNSGVSNARNTGIRSASGVYIIFIDDDQVPGENWLRSYILLSENAPQAAFGPVEPIFEAALPQRLRSTAHRAFSRRLSVATGADVTTSRAYLGTGNSMFKSSLFADGLEFSQKFNSGGEDVSLLRLLAEEKCVQLIWCREAVVYEHVPATRTTSDYLIRRRFNDGRIRCQVEFEAPSPFRWGRVTFWMAVGLAQYIFFPDTTNYFVF